MSEKSSLNARLINASLNAYTGDILYTFVLTYPRFILSEVNTHRMFSRNTSSSRAIPVKTLRKNVLHDPFVPMFWGSNQKGMQAGEELPPVREYVSKLLWKWSRYPAVATSFLFEKLGLHKQIANRILEPWMWTRQIVSTTDVDNFFKQRCHKSAEPHMRLLAGDMRQASTGARDWLMYMEHQGIRTFMPNKGCSYKVLQPGQWHLPFIDGNENNHISTNKQVSAARCARVSYRSNETGRWSTVEEDVLLFDRLAKSDPKHLSPMEHQAMAMDMSIRSGNFVGWKQFRKELE